MENQTLVILEVSQKQAYIFGSKQLRQNIIRSRNIEDVTSYDFIHGICSDFSDENMVYTGGGHTVLQFPSEDDAIRTVRAVTAASIARFPGMELFAAHIVYDGKKSPGENLFELTKRLEEKKARRQNALGQNSYGIEQWDVNSKGPLRVQTNPVNRSPKEENIDGWVSSSYNDRIIGEGNMMAVVHIDGNAMGTRVQKIYEEMSGKEWKECKARLQAFSQSIKDDFESAYRATVQALITRSSAKARTDRILPIRRIITAGDDVCFITVGSLGLEAAAEFLHSLSQIRNRADGLPYTACAGIVIVHGKYPFHKAYEMTEELCGNAKKFIKELRDRGGSDGSAMDWVLETGQLKDSIEDIQDDFLCDDGTLLSMRPLIVTGANEELDRRFAYTQNLFWLIGDNTQISLSKLKKLRPFMKQGEAVTALAVKTMSLTSLYDKIKQASNNRISDLYMSDNGTKRCVIYDAVEMLKRIELLEAENEG